MANMTPSQFDQIAEYECWVRDTFQDERVVVKWHELLQALPQTEPFDPEELGWEAYRQCSQPAAQAAAQMSSTATFASGEVQLD